VLGFDFAVGDLVFPGPHLIFRQNQVFLCGLASNAFSRLEKVSQSCRNQTHRTPAAEISIPRFGQFVGHANLSERRLVDRQLDDGLLDVILDPVLDTRFGAAHFFQSQLAAFLVQLLETIETIA
jgi:hypothetical protein